MNQAINQLIKYQNGAAVSKEIIKKPTGTITLFAFAKNQGLSEHTAPFEALILITDGESEVILSEKKYFLKTGDYLLIPANSIHSLKAISKFKMLLVMIRS